MQVVKKTIYYGLEEGEPTIWDEYPISYDPYYGYNQVCDCSVYGEKNLVVIYDLVYGKIYTSYIIGEKTFDSENKIAEYLVKNY